MEITKEGLIELIFLGYSYNYVLWGKKSIVQFKESQHDALLIGKNKDAILSLIDSWEKKGFKCSFKGINLGFHDDAILALKTYIIANN
jgi:hypothetical protein